MLSPKVFALAQLAWIAFAAIGLGFLGLFTLESLFLVFYAGFLCSIALTATLTWPWWRRRLKWPIAAGLVVFALVVVRRIATVV